MDLTQYTTHIGLVVAAWVIGLLIGRRSKQSTGESFLSKLFSSNRDLDTTLSIVGIFAIVFTMALCFHDDVSDKAGMILISALATMREITRSLFPSGAKNGHHDTLLKARDNSQ